jgi:hypothetical protein
MFDFLVFLFKVAACSIIKFGGHFLFVFFAEFKYIDYGDKRFD